MAKTAKVILLALILACVMTLLTIFGCSGKETADTQIVSTLTTEPTPALTETITTIPETTTPTLQSTNGGLNQQQLSQILSDSINNYKELTTYKYSVIWGVETDTIGGLQAGTMNLGYTANGVTDIVAKQSQTHLFMTLINKPSGKEGSSKNISYDIYMLADWLYINIDNNWVRTPLTSALEQSLKLNIVDQQIVLLKSPAKIELLPSEIVDGLECFVLSITPDMDDVTQWFNEQQNGSGIVNLGNNVDFTGDLKSFSCVYVITKESNLLIRSIIKMLMEFTPEQLGASPGDFDKVTMDFDSHLVLYAQNKDISITLPEEAANAKDVTQDTIVPK